MALDGTFLLKSNDNYDAWLQAVGVPAELAAKMCAAKPKLIVTKTDTGMSVKTLAGDKEFNNSVVFGQDSVADVAGLKYTLNVKVTGNGYSGTIAMGGKTGTVEVVVAGDGFTQTTVVGGVTGKRVYTRA